MVIGAAASASSNPGTSRSTGIVEVDREVFISILTRLDKPLVLERRTRVPKGYVYVVGFSDFYFVLKEKDQQDFTRWADVIPVIRFFQGWAMSTL